jgi:hypothetical protein
MAVGWEGIYTMEGRKSKPAGDTNQQGFVQYVSLRNGTIPLRLVYIY